MPKNVKLNHPCVFFNNEDNMYYLYGDGKTAYTSADLRKWKKADANLPDLLEPAVIKVRDEYRIYTVTEKGILLYTSKSPFSDFIVRDYVITQDMIEGANDIRLRKPSVMLDPISHDCYMVYGCGGDGLFLLHLNPRNGLAHVEGAGVCIATRPSFDDMISGGCIEYNSELGYYYLYAIFGAPEHGSVRVARSKKVNGPYIDIHNHEMTDTNDFDGQIGYMPACPHLLDGFPEVDGYSSPSIVTSQDFGSFICFGLYADLKADSIVSASNLIYANEWPIIIPEGYRLSIDQQMSTKSASAKDIALKVFSAADINGRYEFIKYTKELPQPVLDYASLNILAAYETGMSSTRNSWAMNIPYIASGRVELGGSNRGYWYVDSFDTVYIRYNHTTEEYKVYTTMNLETNEPVLMLIGRDNNGLVCIAKNFERRGNK